MIINPTGAKIQKGSYIGTGTYGTTSPCILTFEFEPRILIISATERTDVVHVRGYVLLTCLEDTSTSFAEVAYIDAENTYYAHHSHVIFRCIREGNSVKFYATHRIAIDDGTLQSLSASYWAFNSNNIEYEYIAIG